MIANALSDVGSVTISRLAGSNIYFRMTDWIRAKAPSDAVFLAWSIVGHSEVMTAVWLKLQSRFSSDPMQHCESYRDLPTPIVRPFLRFTCRILRIRSRDHLPLTRKRKG